MGDMADFSIDEGELALTPHERGECGGPRVCPLCDEEVSGDDRPSRAIELVRRAFSKGSG